MQYSEKENVSYKKQVRILFLINKLCALSKITFINNTVKSTKNTKHALVTTQDK